MLVKLITQTSVVKKTFTSEITSLMKYFEVSRFFLLNLFICQLSMQRHLQKLREVVAQCHNLI